MICGVDEAGRGPVLGPLVVAGVALPKEDEKELVRMGAKDSKRLTPARREELSKTIKERWAHHAIIVPAADIDLLRREMTLNVLEANLFAAVIEHFPEANHAYVDSADVNEEGFSIQIRSQLSRKIIITSRHRADDRYPVVSAASIIAKVERDRQIRKIAEDLGATDGEMGSGYPSDVVTIAFIERWLNEHGTLPPHTRRSWKTAQRLLEKASMKSLDDFGGK
ncbi:MAG: ribonuclease HII [Candidatus Thermoplasmatota archaeon]|nr:ribonuclease HII [Candidatus Thermoplasmatota archaeon]